ncbi:cellulase family glycosylhydrolase [Aquimarina hainanensis]|uniref:mannan endo-1,4-beta-mannosidase n=1 Tax=Aquimarina hainanensis TaxID=1578017 RepID=A0ABW5N6W2_9FLAO|nr:cellulase family glycosylhydrolase [Aquimarina sp. TRL1]QKX03962.1 cellulase family glycosylhydrolase [Aquimarina sp. TRL1]
MKRWNRAIYIFLIGIGFTAVIAIVLLGLSKVFSFLNTGADRSSMLHISMKKDFVYLPTVSWRAQDNPGREVDSQTLTNISNDYLSAWYVRNVSYQTNDSTGIDQYYTKSARKNLINNINYNKKMKNRIEATTLQHHLFLEFYSADGQTVVFTDKDVKEYQRVYRNKDFMMDTELTSTYKVVMLLEDGFWRIRHIVKDKLETIQDSIEVNKKAAVKGDTLLVNNYPYTVKGINYYPKDAPWNMYGDTFDVEVIEKDFEIIKEAGLNTIRIFVPYQEFGKEKVKIEKLEKLTKVLDLAEKKAIKVVVTLFDFYGDYSVLDWTVTHRHVEQLVRAYKDHKAILAWDIKNEPDLDFDSRTKEAVVAWLREMIRQIRRYDPNHLITIGWYDMQSSLILEKEVDFLSFHYYGDIKEFSQQYDTLQTKTSKPLVLQEYGLSSSKGLWNPFGATQEDQAIYYKDFHKILREKDVHVMSWTLYDFDKIPTSVVGRLPWRKHKQKFFGFIDTKGNKKPAFQFISR